MKKKKYTKTATTYGEQIATLKRHGLIVEDVEKAEEYLSAIGYYRLGFYIYPFEETYPALDKKRRHNVKAGTRFDDVVALYNFDMDLRNIVSKYLSEIEVVIRNTFIYQLSIKYNSNPTWFVDSSVMTTQFIDDFYEKAYKSIRKHESIRRHHEKYRGQYAPAWKTMEYMTLGNMEVLYANLLLDKDKVLVSRYFGEPSSAAFKSYLGAIRDIRNACAHGNLLYELRLQDGVKVGKACASFKPHTSQTLCGALKVADYLLRRISVNKADNMWRELANAVERLNELVPSVVPIVKSQTGIELT
ncbi:MAG: Abi family protein [Duncaniella sp.]|nr:Abi family protein [Duncaniella sp.]